MRGSTDLGGCFPTGRHYPGIAHLLRVAVAGLAEEYASETPMESLPILSIDTETTGLEPTRDRIVELALIRWRDGQIADRKSWLIDPGCPISQEASDVHGITDDDVRGKPSFSDVASEIIGALDGAVPLAYNAEFDREFLNAELRRSELVLGEPPPTLRRAVEWLDPFVFARELHKDEKGRSLGDVCARLGVELTRAHRATDDAEAAARVLSAFLRDVRVPKTYGAFVQEQRRLARAFAREREVWRDRP